MGHEAMDCRVTRPNGSHRPTNHYWIMQVYLREYLRPPHLMWVCANSHSHFTSNFLKTLLRVRVWKKRELFLLSILSNKRQKSWKEKRPLHLICSLPPLSLLLSFFFPNPNRPLLTWWWEGLATSAAPTHLSSFLKTLKCIWRWS